MDETKRKSSNVAVEQMIGNMTSDIQNADGQYIQLGFTPPQTPVDMHWGSTNRITQNPFISHYNQQQECPLPYPTVEQMPQVFTQQGIPYNYVPNHLFSSSDYDKRLDPHESFLNYNNHVQDVNMCTYPSNYRLFMSPNEHCYVQDSMNPPPTNNHTHLIDNLVGNWVPNTSGTYSPFGNVQQSKINCFKLQSESEQQSPQKTVPCSFVEPIGNEVNNTIQFNRDVKKPTAEVKPMRPTYSDVLTKSVPNVPPKVGKIDPSSKELKQKTQTGNKKGGKSERASKSGGSSLNRSTPTNTDTKETMTTTTAERGSSLKPNEKLRDIKTNQLNRKWASLDNVHECDDLNNVRQELNGTRKNNKKFDDASSNKSSAKNVAGQRRIGKSFGDWEETDSGNSKTEERNVIKTTVKKGKDKNTSGRQRSNDGFSCNERPPGKRGQRARKRENHTLGIFGQTLKHFMGRWWRMAICIVMWLLHLVYDIFSLSAHLSKELCSNSWTWLQIHWNTLIESTTLLLNHIQCIRWLYNKIKGKEAKEETSHSFTHLGLQHNIAMPCTGEDAMKRLLACKGKDPYSILGVTPTCTDDDIKRYYKRQAFLVHPDKNQQPGAEEAFKILVHAFDMIGEPERRAAYDRGVAESAQVEQAWSELTELLAQLQQKVEAAANTIRCSACSARHKRIKMDRPIYAARHCSMCRINHAAREGDIWAEARCMGFLWHYYACMEGGVYDITEWAGCQRDSLKHLRPDTHHVQYRIALGRPAGPTRKSSNSARTESPPDLEHLLSSLYGQPEGTQNPRRRNKRTSK